MSFGRGDVVYGADPFKGEDYSRPWLVISNGTHPYQGDQYVVLALTTRTWHDGLVPLSDDDWIEGGTPESSSVIPWSVETLDHADVDHWQGTRCRGRERRCVGTDGVRHRALIVLERGPSRTVCLQLRRQGQPSLPLGS